MKRLFAAIIICLSLTATPVLSATWYLSPTGSNTTGDGSIGNPWFSPAKARAGNSGVAPGDTVIFLNGTYSYSSTDCLLGYSSDDSGTLGNPITYRAEDTTHSAIINANTDYGFRLNDDVGSSYIVIDGLIIINHGYSGVFIDDDHQTVRNCYFTATASWPPSGEPNSDADGGGGINTTQTGTDFLIENCIMDDVAYTNSSHGIYCGGGSGIIRYCVMRNNFGNGIQIQSGAIGHVIGDVYVYGNLIYNNNGRHGIYSSSYSGGTIGNVYVYNNLIAGNGLDYSSGYGITVSNTSTYTGVYIWNNTLYGNHYGININAVSGEMRNNISVSSTGWTDVSSATMSNGSLTKSHNLTTDGDEGAGIAGAFDPAHFASVTATDSDFLELLATATEAINTGYDLSAFFTIDFSDTTRTSGFDIGAYEYVSGTTYDLPAITGPADFSTTSSSVEIEGPYTLDVDLPDQTVVVMWTLGGNSGFAVAALGVFSCTVPVELGSNSIVFEITDSNSGSAADTTIVTRTETYQTSTTNTSLSHGVLRH